MAFFIYSKLNHINSEIEQIAITVASVTELSRCTPAGLEFDTPVINVSAFECVVYKWSDL